MVCVDNASSWSYINVRNEEGWEESIHDRGTKTQKCFCTKVKGVGWNVKEDEMVRWHGFFITDGVRGCTSGGL